MLRFWCPFFVVLAALVGEGSVVRAQQSAQDQVEQLTRDKERWNDLGRSLESRAYLIGLVTKKMPGMRECVESIGRDMQGLVSDCSAYADTPNLLECLSAAQSSIVPLLVRLNKCRSAIKESGVYYTKPYLTKDALRASNDQVRQGFASLRATEEALRTSLMAYYSTLDGLLTVVQGQQGEGTGILSQEAWVEGAIALRFRAYKALHKWHAPRAARLILLSSQPELRDEIVLRRSVRAPNWNKDDLGWPPQAKPPFLEPVSSVWRDVTEACDNLSAHHDAMRQALICGVADNTTSSEACRARAEALCDAEGETLTHEQEAIAIFEQCLEGQAS